MSRRAKCGDGIHSVADEVCGGGIYSAANRGLRTTRLHSAAALFWAALREIFDESAYKRFLRRHRLSPSRRSYAAFVREHACRKAHQARCC